MGFSYANDEAPISCQVCGSVDAAPHITTNDYVTKEQFTVYSCGKCGICFTWPQPSDIDRYYPASYRRYIAPLTWLLRVIYRLHVKKWVGELGKSGRALEIGCGSGWMMKALHDQGWQVIGLERNKDEAEFASAATGLQILSCSIDEIKQSEYDLILLFNVLEHMRDPRTVIRQCSRLLKENGTIIIGTHNFTSWQARITGQYWISLDVPRHFTHFSPRSLATLLNSEELEIVSTKYVSWVYDPYCWIQSFLNYFGFGQNFLTNTLMKKNWRNILTPSSFAMIILTALLTPLSLLLSISSWFVGSGAEMEVWARKRVREGYKPLP